MRFEHVHVESGAHALPERVVTSLELERRLALLYARLRVSEGRLELMSGIRERRAWPAGTRPSDVAARAGAIALERSGIARERFGLLVHASVCRDFLEPATASVVHASLEMPATCAAFDLSNACLGFVNAMVVAAEWIERRTIDAALVVAGEDGGPLVEATIASLLATDAVGRDELKRAFASLTIGSGAAACVLAHREIARSPRRLLGATSRAATEHHVLCHGDRASGADGPLMETDSEALLHAGNALARDTFAAFERETGFTRASIERVVTHQVGSAHRRLLFETLGLDLAKDFPTVETLGNMGSVSLPATLALGEEAGFIAPTHRTALFGIGSGLHCSMLALGP